VQAQPTVDSSSLPSTSAIGPNHSGEDGDEVISVPLRCPFCKEQLTVLNLDGVQQCPQLKAPKSFVCPLCLEPFSSRVDALQHFASGHTDTKPFKCPLCSGMFNRKANLKTHLQT